MGLLARVGRIVEQLGQIQWKYSGPTRRIRDMPLVGRRMAKLAERANPLFLFQIVRMRREHFLWNAIIRIVQGICAEQRYGVLMNHVVP